MASRAIWECRPSVKFGAGEWPSLMPLAKAWMSLAETPTAPPGRVADWSSGGSTFLNPSSPMRPIATSPSLSMLPGDVALITPSAPVITMRSPSGGSETQDMERVAVAPDSKWKLALI